MWGLRGRYFLTILEVIAAVCHLGVPNSQILLNQIAASSCNLAILPKAPSELASAFFDNSAANQKKSVFLTCFHYRYDLWYTSGCAETIRNPALLIAWHAAVSSSSRTGEKINLWSCGNWCLGAVHGCVLPYVPGASFLSTCGSCKLYMWMLKTNTAGTGTWAVTNKEAYLITLKADILSANNQKLLLFQFQIQVFKQMGASSNGGTPISHPKCWSLFSRKTNPWFCWVCTTILVRNPQISSNFQLSPTAWLQSWTKTFCVQSPAFEYGWPDGFYAQKLTVCPVVLAKDLDTS